MDSHQFLRMNLERNGNWVLLKLGSLSDAPLTFPTPDGGCHPLWVAGHLAYTEASLVHSVMQGQPNPLADWQDLFGNGSQPVADAGAYPPYGELLAKCREVRDETLAWVDTLSEADLDQPCRQVPERMKSVWTDLRQCLQFTVDHWFMHYGQLIDAGRARRAAQ